jgi:undecaprenyl phosphate N,N'-diacetylbacillosamine 1-phosphate transferase
MQRKQGFYEKYIKRLLDIICSLLAIVVFCWLYAIIAILVRVKLGSPVLFKQPRPGKDEKIFSMYKFRTMSDARDENGELLPDKDRMTRFGKILRKLSIDELPELWNILKGDMSIIGPRPLLVRYLPYYRENERRRHSVRPGMTGLAQVCGRNFLSWDERFAKDVEYVDHLTFRLDVAVVFRTILIILNRSGIIEYDNVSQCTLRDLDEERAHDIQKV